MIWVWLAALLTLPLVIAQDYGLHWDEADSHLTYSPSSCFGGCNNTCGAGWTETCWVNPFWKAGTVTHPGSTSTLIFQGHRIEFWTVNQYGGGKALLTLDNDPTITIDVSAPQPTGAAESRPWFQDSLDETKWHRIVLTCADTRPVHLHRWQVGRSSGLAAPVGNAFDDKPSDASSPTPTETSSSLQTSPLSSSSTIVSSSSSNPSASASILSSISASFGTFGVQGGSISGQGVVTVTESNSLSGTSPAHTDQADNSNSGSSINAALLGGLVAAGIIIALILILTIAFFLYRRHRRRVNARRTAVPMDNTPALLPVAGGMGASTDALVTRPEKQPGLFAQPMGSPAAPPPSSPSGGLSSPIISPVTPFTSFGHTSIPGTSALALTHASSAPGPLDDAAPSMLGLSPGDTRSEADTRALFAESVVSQSPPPLYSSLRPASQLVQPQNMQLIYPRAEDP